ncbi:MAG: hypothetical protein R3C14_05795 [Caldilineaceae bacterium]
MAREEASFDSALRRARSATTLAPRTPAFLARAPDVDGNDAWPGDVTFSSSATLNAQFWLEQFPWRPTAAWATIAGLLAVALEPQGGSVDWRTIVLLLLLVDPLWGSIWRLAAGRDELLPLQHKVMPRPVWLPYMKAGSPAAQLFDGDYVRAMPLLFRVGLPSLILAGALAVVLTPVALWMTLLVFGLSVIGWITRRALHSTTSLLHSLVTITLPWLLTLSLFGQQLTDRDWVIHCTLIIFWTLHNWGEGRNLRAAADPLGLLLLAVAEVGLISMLIFSQAPLALAMLVVLWLPTWLAIYHRQSLQHLQFIWLLAMLLSAWALGQTF